MTHKEIVRALTGLLLGMFVAMLSSTVVSNALPRIVTDLEGSQTGYTWVVVATLLTMTATTPIWGKLADLFPKKLLVQSALVIFSVGSLLAGLAPNMGTLIGARAVQGLGVGGMTALVQVVIASMVTPRERGRYSGYIGATFAAATVSGPLLGGLIVDSPLGWRGTFFLAIPLAAAAFIVLQRTLHLPTVKRQVSIDYLGATLIMAGVSALLIWISLAGSNFDWVSAASAALVGGGLVLIAIALWVEARVATDPIIPLRLFRDRTTSLATAASVMIGVAMFGATVYLSQYFQLARGMSPTEAGLMSIAMVGGLLVSSIVSGRIITRTGFWKRWLIGGMVFVVTGFGLLGTIDADTPLPLVGLFMALVGVGIGATMQNLVLAVQNNTAPQDMGAASSLVAFFRSLGGSAGVSALGAVLAHQVTDGFADGIGRLVAAGRIDPAQLEALRHSNGDIPDVSRLPGPIADVYQHAFGDAIGHLFWIAVPFALVAFGCILFIKEVPLRTTLGPTVAESEMEAGMVATGEPVDWPTYHEQGDDQDGREPAGGGVAVDRRRDTVRDTGDE
ncbi:MFS transporter [Nocardioides sp. BGMRC 2183]|nr:MFS transporter [Nocardioides sp. BGMRC 2183]